MGSVLGNQDRNPSSSFLRIFNRCDLNQICFGVRPFVLQKLVLSVPFLHRWKGSCGQLIQASVQGPHWARALVTQENSRRLELSISKNTQHRRWGQGPGSVDPRFSAGLPFPVPEILEFVAFCDSGTFFQQFSPDFPGVFLRNPRTDPGNSHSLLEFSELLRVCRPVQIQ